MSRVLRVGREKVPVCTGSGVALQKGGIWRTRSASLLAFISTASILLWYAETFFFKIIKCAFLLGAEASLQLHAMVKWALLVTIITILTTTNNTIIIVIITALVPWVTICRFHKVGLSLGNHLSLVLHQTEVAGKENVGTFLQVLDTETTAWK